MTVTTLSGRELNQDLGRAKRATKDGPVIITDRGRPAHVLLSFDEYKRRTGLSLSPTGVGLRMSFCRSMSTSGLQAKCERLVTCWQPRGRKTLTCRSRSAWSVPSRLIYPDAVARY